MSKLEQMPHAEFTRGFAEYKAEAARRVRELAELMGMPTEGKRGRPATNSLANLLNGGADPETDPDAASVVTQ